MIHFLIILSLNTVSFPPNLGANIHSVHVSSEACQAAGRVALVEYEANPFRSSEDTFYFKCVEGE